ncbi:hypothetical protein D3C72_1993260 [compost metagenome]
MPGTHDDTGIGSIVADGVVHLSHGLCVAVQLFDACVDDFNGWRHIVGGIEHVGNAKLPAIR